MGKVYATYYLRLIWMFVNLSTETVRSVFCHFTNTDNISIFLTSPETQQKIEQLRKKKVIDKKGYDIVKTGDADKFDLTLLITLIINLIDEKKLPPPLKGWEHIPKPKDKSLAADLLRLRRIRNEVFAHSLKAELEKEKYDDDWENIKKILIRVEGKIKPPDNTQTIEEKVDHYRQRPFDEQITEDAINEWKLMTLDLQKQLDDMLKCLSDFDKYFKSQSNHRYDQYIHMLDKCGSFVLSSYLKLKIKKSGKEFNELLRQEECRLRKSIKDQTQAG